VPLGYHIKSEENWHQSIHSSTKTWLLLKITDSLLNIRQTRKCVRYYTKVTCANILEFVTLVRALVHFNFLGEVRLGGLGSDNEGPTLGQYVKSACATIPLGSGSVYNEV